MEEIKKVMVEENDNQIAEELHNNTDIRDNVSINYTDEEKEIAAVLENSVYKSSFDNENFYDSSKDLSVKDNAEFDSDSATVASNNHEQDYPADSKACCIDIAQTGKVEIGPETECASEITCKKRGRKKSSSAPAIKALSITELNDEIRSKLVEALTKVMNDMYGECLRVVPYDDSISARKFSLASPCVDSDGNEKWIKVDIAIPHGNRTTKEYDGYEMNKRFMNNVKAKALEEAIKTVGKTHRGSIEKTHLSEALEDIAEMQSKV